MIARIWQGATRAGDADEYLERMRRIAFSEYLETPGNRGLIGLRRRNGDRTELLLLTLWDDMDAIRRFAGDDPDRAVFYPEDERYLVERGEQVSHFEVVDVSLDGASNAEAER
jgi:heme-degrading monooxygenase HmoA